MIVALVLIPVSHKMIEKTVNVNILTCMNVQVFANQIIEIVDAYINVMLVVKLKEEEEMLDVYMLKIFGVILNGDHQKNPQIKLMIKPLKLIMKS
jgi:hypothetical protein